jgi:HEAT repeat protein
MIPNLIFRADAQRHRRDRPEFEAWAKTQNLSPTELGEDYVYLLPGEVAFLGWSRDPRAVPLLRQALLSPNYQIEIAAALGLAEIGNDESIPLIINACSKAPRDAAAAIAQALVYFDEPAAQRAVDQYIPAEAARVYRDARANGMKTPWTVY